MVCAKDVYKFKRKQYKKIKEENLDTQNPMHQIVQVLQGILYILIVPIVDIKFMLIARQGYAEIVKDINKK